MTTPKSDRYYRMLNGAAEWIDFYRKNPEKFAEDYLHLRLLLFQKILLVMMMWSTTFVFIASRGIGKSFLSAIYCVIRCILYPGTRICIVSGTRGQAINVLEKITQELMPKSDELRAEIKEVKINGTDAKIVFNNTSVIKVVTASDTARGNRCNVLILDEFRLISKEIINTVLKQFLTYHRMPEYSELSDRERREEYNKEKNLTMYLSSAFWKDHWSYQRCTDTAKGMINPNRHQFICAFPYQLPISEGILDPEVVEDMMSESDFSEIKFSMEMEALFYGSSDGAFFDFESMSRNRKIKYPWLPEELSSRLNSSKALSIPPKEKGEIRVLSADIALMSSKKHDNDATAIWISSSVRSKSGRYVTNFMYGDNDEGKRTEDEAFKIRRLFDEYDCDMIALDTNGLGLGVYDALSRDIMDPDTGDFYPALSCYNDSEMASRCTVPGAQKAIWSIKAGAQFNSDCAFMVREGFRSGRIRLLQTEYDSESALKELKGFSSLPPIVRTKFQLPYINTTLMIDETTKLLYEKVGDKIRLHERSGMRKDRYSSISYNYYVAMQLEQKMNRKENFSSTYDNSFAIKMPNSPLIRRGGNGRFGRKETNASTPAWF